MNWKQNTFWISRLLTVILILVAVLLSIDIINALFGERSLELDKFGGVIIAAFSLLAIFLSNRIAKERYLEENLKDQKKEAYEKFIATITAVSRSTLNRKANVSNTTDEEEGEQIDLRKEMAILNERFLIWFKDESLYRYSKCRFIIGKYSNTSDIPSAIVKLLALEEMLRIIRSDIGHSNMSQKPGMLLNLIDVNIDKYLKENPETVKIFEKEINKSL